MHVVMARKDINLKLNFIPAQFDSIWLELSYTEKENTLAKAMSVLEATHRRLSKWNTAFSKITGSKEGGHTADGKRTTSYLEIHYLQISLRI